MAAGRFRSLITNDEVETKLRSDLIENDTEILWIEVCPFKSKCSFVIAGIYRPPSTNYQDDTYMLNKEIILLGDCNIDFLNVNQFNKHKLVKSLHLTQLINQSMKPMSKTGLDRFWTSHMERITIIDIKLVGLSGHLTTIAVG